MFENITITNYQGYHTCDICKTFEASNVPATYRVDAERRGMKVHTHLCDIHIKKWEVKKGGDK